MEFGFNLYMCEDDWGWMYACLTFHDDVAALYYQVDDGWEYSNVGAGDDPPKGLKEVYSSLDEMADHFMNIDADEQFELHQKEDPEGYERMVKELCG